MNNDEEQSVRSGTRLFCYKVNWTRVLSAVAVVLVASNIYIAYTLKNLNDDKLNALGTTLTYTKLFYLESVELIDAAAVSGTLDQELLDALERDCIQLSRLLNILRCLDGDNAQKWSEIKIGIDTLMQFSTNLKNRLAHYLTYENKDYFLTEEQSHHFNVMRDALGEFKGAFPEKVIIGSYPSVEVPREGIRRAAEASQQLCTNIYAARLAFSLDGN